MKKVTILAFHLNYGGIEKSVCSLANILCEKYDVEIIAIYKLENGCVFNLDKRIKVKYLMDGSLAKDVEKYKLLLYRFKIFKLFKVLYKDYGFNIKALYKDTRNSRKLVVAKKEKMIEAIKNSDADIMISSRTYLNTLVGKYAPKNTLKIGWEHNHHRKSVKNINRVVASTITLDKVVFVSNSLKKWYEREYKVRRINVEAVHIPNFLENIPARKSKLNTNNFISVGRLSEEKGFLDLIKVFNIMYLENKNIHLDIIGDGDEYENIVHLIQELKLTKAITLHGYQDKEYINKMYENSSIYLMTSHTESFGLVLIEAMSYGLPCISFTSAEGASELIENTYNGYLIENRDMIGMASAALTLLEDKDRLKIMSKNAIEVASKYDKTKISKEWFELLKNKNTK